MRRYFMVVVVVVAAIAIAVAVSSQLRRGASSEAQVLPRITVAPPAQYDDSIEASDTRQPVAGGDTQRPSAPEAAPAQTPRPAKPQGARPPPPRETARPKAPIGTVSPTGDVKPISSASPDAAAILRKAAAAYRAVRSLKADFTQWQENPLLGKRTSSRGTVYQRRPDRLLLRFTQPAGDVIVSDGEFFWIYYPSVDARQVIRAPAGAAGGLDLQAQFIGDPTQRFSYTMQATEPVAGRPARVFALVPRVEAGYRSLKVWVDLEDYLVRRFELTSETGVVQHYDLTNLEINTPLPDQLFKFTPPRDARIVTR